MMKFNLSPDYADMDADEVKSRRKRLAKSLVGRRSAPTAVEGLAQIGAALFQRNQRNKLNDRHGELRDEFDAKFDRVIGFGGPTTISENAPSSPGFFPQTYDPNGDEIRDGLIETAQAIGADPLDLATAVSYETAGTFDPTKSGPTTQHGQHRGLIQFGEPQAEQYGVDWADPVGSQLGPDGAVARYFQDRGFQPGMSGLDLYSTINAGAPGLYDRSDAQNNGMPGSVRDKWQNQMADHRAKAAEFLGGEVQPVTSTNSGGQRYAATENQAALMQLMRDPMATAEDRQILGTMLQRQMDANQPMSEMDQLELERARLELDQLQNPQPGFRPATQEEAAPYGVPGQIGPDGRFYPIKGADSTNINVNTGPNQSEFAKATGKALADETSQVVEQGMGAQRSIGQLMVLEDALNNAPQGAAGAITSFASNLGIPVEGRDQLQVAQAIISQMVPAQRPPGSGTMSDADLALFKQSLPRLINSPEGNRRIIATLRAISEYDVARMGIARQMQLGEITPQQGFEAYTALGNPIPEDLRTRGGQSASAGQPAPVAVPQPVPQQVPVVPQQSSQGAQRRGDRRGNRSSQPPARDTYRNREVFMSDPGVAEAARQAGVSVEEMWNILQTGTSQ